MGGVQLAPHLGKGRDELHDPEVVARRQPRHQLAALVRAALVHDDGREVLDVEVDGVAEEERLEDRDEEDEPHRDRVAPEVGELLPDEGQEALHAAAPRSLLWRASETKTSSRDGSAGSGGPVLPRRRIADSPAPGRATARSRVPKRYASSSAASPRTAARAANGSDAGGHLEEAAGQPFLQVGRRPLGDQFPLQEEGEAVALLRFVHVVRRDEDGHPAPRGQLVDEVPEDPPPLRVDAPRRLVEEEELRLVEERSGEGDALAPAGRERLGQIAAEAREAEPFGQLADPVREAGVREAVGRAEEPEVLLHGQVEVEGELLAHVAEPRLPAVGVADDVEPAEARHGAGRGREEARQHPDRRRLSGPVRAEESEDLPARNVEADAVDRREVAEAPRQGADGDGGVAHASSLRRTKTSSSDGGMRRMSPRRDEALEGPRDLTFEELFRLLLPAGVKPGSEERDVVHDRKLREERSGGEAVAGPDLHEGAVVEGQDLVARPDRRETPPVEEADPRRVLGLVHVRRRDEDRQPLRVELVQEEPELAPRNGVDAGRRLVEEEEVGPRQERRDERELLLHPARERAREAAADAREPHPRKKGGRALARLAVRDRVHPRPEEEVLVDREVLVEREALRHHAERPALLDGDRAARRREEAGDAAEERRLSGAVGADQGEELPARDGEVDAVERLHGAEAPREGLRLDHFAGSAAVTATSAGCPGTSGSLQPPSRSTFAA